MPEQEPQAAKTDMAQDGVASRVPIWDLVRYYLRLGALGFGGPVVVSRVSCRSISALTDAPSRTA